MSIVERSQLACRLEFFVIAGKGFMYKLTVNKPISIERVKMLMATLRLGSDVYNYRCGPADGGVRYEYFWTTYER
jgi:hypothetical protein